VDLPVQRYPIRKRLSGFKGSGFNVLKLPFLERFNVQGSKFRVKLTPTLNLEP
jgi:hypothetical protein